MAAHAKLSASGVYKWAFCPGSVAAEEGIAEQSSEYAAEGTAAHALAEHCLKHGVDPVLQLGGQFEGFTVDEEMVDAVDYYIQTIAPIRYDEMFVEHRVQFSDFIPEGFGTADFIGTCYDGRVYIYDLKYGKGVKVTDTLQQRIYALGVIQELDWLYDFKEFKLVIVQPRLDHVASEIITKDELLEWWQDFIVPAVVATVDPEAPRVPGEKQCKFCKAKGTCPALAAEAVSAAMEGFDDLMVLPSDQPLATKDLTPAEIGVVLSKLPLLRNWMSAIEAQAVLLIETGNDVEGWKLVEGRSNRKWKDEEKAAAYVQRKVGAAKAFEKKLISPAAAEKLIGKAIPGLEAHITKGEGKPTLAPAGDKRPALTFNVKEGFEE